MFHQIGDELYNFDLIQRVYRWYDQPGQKRGITVHFVSGEQIAITEKHEPRAFQQLNYLLTYPQKIEASILYYPDTWPRPNYSLGQLVYSANDKAARRVMGIAMKEISTGGDQLSQPQYIWHYLLAGKGWTSEENILLERANTSPP